MILHPEIYVLFHFIVAIDFLSGTWSVFKYLLNCIVASFYVTAVSHVITRT